MKTFKPLLVAALCALSLAAPAIVLAQGVISDATQTGAPSSQASGSPGHRHHGMMSMLKTLDLSQQQQNQIKTLVTNYKQAHPKGSQPDDAARKQLRNQVLAVLTPAQRTKLEQEKAAWHKQHPSPAPSASP